MGASLAKKFVERGSLDYYLVNQCLSWKIQAAKFGRAFLDLYNPIDFVTMGQTLKVLNAVQYYTVGIPLTYAQ